MQDYKENQAGPQSQARTTRRITRGLWRKMLAAYRERPKIEYVANTCGVGVRMARRAVRKGWEDLDLPAFQDIVQTESHIPQTKTIQTQPQPRRLSLPELDAQKPSPNPDPNEPDASDLAMTSAVSVAQVTSQFAQEILERIQVGQGISVGEISPKAILELVRAVNYSNELTKRAIELKELQRDKPNEQFWTELGMLLDRCTEEELVEVAKTGKLPHRLLYEGPKGQPQVKVAEDLEPEQLMSNIPSGKPDELTPDPLKDLAGLDDLDDLPEPDLKG